MLFTTATFALLFLPVVLTGYFVLGRQSERLAAAWLFVASVFFYGYWMPAFTLLLLGSITANFWLGMRISAARVRGVDKPGAASAWLTIAIAFNLGLLGYFKYANFFVDNLNALVGQDWQVGAIVLPIGISFYTFTQIAYLVDTRQGLVTEARPAHYGLFVTYFPHLVAGPVLHHAQMMPQFAQASVYRFDGANFCGGLTIFCMGLIKKVVLADGIAPYADAVFVPVDGGSLVGGAEAWIGAMAYTFQLYFDFSGYSDMAIGLSWMFNIRLPFNFDSPYKARNISDFWRRWHMTLSKFLRDYLYVPLGGNRKGALRRYVNLGLTMLLGGLWHGASWSFVLWGALHGAYLMVNHAFSAVVARSRWRSAVQASRLFSVTAWALTFLSTVAAWVFFRAETLPGAIRMLQGMAGLAPAEVDPGLLLWNAGLHPAVAVGWCVVLGFVSFVLPNSNDLGDRWIAQLRERENWQTAVGTAAALAVIMLIVLNTARDSVSAFIYFNF